MEFIKSLFIFIFCTLYLHIYYFNQLLFVNIFSLFIHFYKVYKILFLIFNFKGFVVFSMLIYNYCCFKVLITMLIYNYCCFKVSMLIYNYFCFKVSMLIYNYCCFKVLSIFIYSLMDFTILY